MDAPRTRFPRKTLAHFFPIRVPALPAAAGTKCSRSVITTRSPPPSRKSIAASILGPMLPGALGPSGGGQGRDPDREEVSKGFPRESRSRRVHGEGPETLVRGFLWTGLPDPIRPPRDGGAGRGDRPDPPSPERGPHPGRGVRRGTALDRPRGPRVSRDGSRPVEGLARGGAE